MNYNFLLDNSIIILYNNTCKRYFTQIMKGRKTMTKNLKLYTGETLKRWDGTAPFIQPHLYYSDAAETELYRDAECNIYCFREDETEPFLWCPSNRLIQHLIKMYQIKNR